MVSQGYSGFGSAAYAGQQGLSNASLAQQQQVYNLAAQQQAAAYANRNALAQQLAAQQQLNQALGQQALLSGQNQLSGLGQNQLANIGQFQLAGLQAASYQNAAALAGLQQNLGLQQPNNAGLSRNSANLGSGQLVGFGYGNRHVAPADIQAQYRGKEAFFDASRGVLFDGQTAYFYAPTGAAVLPENATSNVYTAIDSANAGYSSAGNGAVILGNNTAGDLAAHRNALASNYAYDGTGYGL